MESERFKPSSTSVDVGGWEFDTEGHIGDVKTTPSGNLTNLAVNVFTKTHKGRE